MVCNLVSRLFTSFDYRPPSIEGFRPWQTRSALSERKNEMKSVSSNTRACQATTAQGNRCQAPAMDGHDQCFFHAPDKKEKRRAAQQAGGVERSQRALALPPEIADKPIRNKRDLYQFLDLIRRGLVLGQVDHKIAWKASQLAVLSLQVLEQAETEEWDLLYWGGTSQETAALEQRRRQRHSSALEIWSRPIEPASAPLEVPSARVTSNESEGEPVAPLQTATGSPAVSATPHVSQEPDLDEEHRKTTQPAALPAGLPDDRNNESAGGTMAPIDSAPLGTDTSSELLNGAVAPSVAIETPVILSDLVQSELDNQSEAEPRDAIPRDPVPMQAARPDHVRGSELDLNPSERDAGDGQVDPSPGSSKT